MPDLPMRQIPRSKLFEVFKTQELVDLYEALLYNAGTSLPAQVQQAIADAAAALEDAQTRQLRANLVGQVAWFACNTPPADWLECNGAVLATADYPALYARIGTTYGGGAGSFWLPDLRGEFVRGWDHGRGVDPGRVFGSTQADELESHTHTVQGTNLFIRDGGGTQGATPAGAFWTPNSPITLDNTGGAETRPRNIALLPCIHT